MPIFRLMLIFVFFINPLETIAQGFQVAFGNFGQDTKLPVEVTADSLSVNQNDGSAIFKGNVNIAQGEMRMKADKVNVHYSSDTSGIARLVATGEVLLTQGPDIAEADMAEYSIEDGTVLMRGNVTVVQDINTIMADEMTMNLRDNTAEMHGSVKTILKSE